MLKRKLCEAVFTWELECEGPLLIADGRYKQPIAKNDDEKGAYPTALFISRQNPDTLGSNALKKPADLKLPYYVPGTSLRGPFRAQAERIIRTLAMENAMPPYTACDPFEQGDSKTLRSCSKCLEKEFESKYKKACPACKLFGAAGLASRIIFTDATIPKYNSVYRDMIGIDRFTGGAYTGGGEGGGAKMRLHVLENTLFTTTITVTNFELWQLGLLAYVFRDFQDGLVPIGYGKTKGFGRVKGKVTGIMFAYPVGMNAGRTLHHLGSLASKEEVVSYGLDSTLVQEFALQPPEPGRLQLYEVFKTDDFDTLAQRVTQVFNTFMNTRKPEVAA